MKGGWREQREIRVGVNVEVPGTRQRQIARYNRTNGCANDDIIVQIHENCLTRVDITDDPVRMSVAVKIGYDSGS